MEEQAAPSLEERVRAHLGEEPSSQLTLMLESLEAVKIADIFYNLGVPDQQRLLGVIPQQRGAAVLSELDHPTLENLAAQLSPGRLAEYIALMEPDDAADVIGILAPDRAEDTLSALPSPFRDEVTLLLAYSPETAGGIMDPDVVRVRSNQTVSEAIEEIRRYVERVELDDFFAAFVVDVNHRLVGVVPNWKMLISDGQVPVVDIMLPDPITVDANLDQEEVSRLVRDHDLVSVPVVNAYRQLIGRITIDDVVDVIEEEHHEDLGHFTGTGTEAVREISVLQTLRVRAPWLVMALGGQMLAAVIMHLRQDFLVTLPQLAFFIPAVMAMGGNTGIQSASLVIRGLATGEVRLSHFWRRLGREVLIALAIGVIFALLLIGGSILLTGHIMLGLVVGLATLVTISIASTAGMVIPMMLQRMKMDPALATGPFLTTLNDVVGVLIYLLVAYWILF